MKARFCIVAGLLFLAVSCQPFLFSLFPGYLADAVAVRDVGAYFTSGSVEHFDFCVLNNGTVEYAFLGASYYDGQRTLFIFNSDLGFVTSLTDPGFGSRHFVDVAGEFIIGNRILAPGTFTVSSMNNTWLDGYGCVLLEGGQQDALFSGGGSSIMVDVYGSGLSATPTNSYSKTLSVNGLYNFNQVYAGRVLNVPTAAGSFNASVMVFRDWSSRPEQGYAAVLLEGPLPATGNYTISSSSISNLLLSSSQYHLVIPLGGIEGDAGVVSATRDGLVVRGADGTLRLFGWNGQVRAVTRDNGASGNVLFDYSPTDHYYVFDPASLKLFKARDWWLKN